MANTEATLEKLGDGDGPSNLTKGQEFGDIFPLRL